MVFQKSHHRSAPAVRVATWNYCVDKIFGHKASACKLKRVRIFAGPCLLNTTVIRSGCMHDNSCCIQVRYIDTLFHRSVILRMIAARPPLAKVDVWQNKEGGNLNDRVIRIYRRCWNTHARMNRNEISCQSRPRVASGPPSLTGLTCPRITLDRMFLRRSDWVSSTQTPHGTKIVFLAAS